MNGIPTLQRSLTGGQIEGSQMSFDSGQVLATTKVGRRSPRKLMDVSEEDADLVMAESQMGNEDMTKGITAGSMPGRGSSLRLRRSVSLASPLRATDTSLTEGADEYVAKGLELVNAEDGKSLASMNTGGEEGSSQDLDMAPESSEMVCQQSPGELSGVTLPSEGVERVGAPVTNVGVPTAISAKIRLKPDSSDVGSDPVETIDGSSTAETGVRRFEPSNGNPLPPPAPLPPLSSGAQARNRWRRAKTKLAFVHHISEGHRRSVSGDFLEDGGDEDTGEENKSVAGKVDGPALKGARLRKEVQGNSGQVRSKGRKGQEGMVVRQDKGMLALVQDFYVACLKMPIAHFLIGVFLAPIALGLFFTPIYLFDKGGLSFTGETSAEASVAVGRAARAKQSISNLMDVFLYALSLSTTFGGSPVAALSTYCLCVANVNTLMGQFLFVFLSGAVFARMSQPSHPIRCSKKAVIRADDFTALPSEELKDRPKVFAVRLVLTGPPPCELVDAKICLTFRILIKLPTGSMFCSTQDLTLVRPEISYLRYGILVRHVIDDKSPIYGHTMESLMDGDASFSLTIMGLERASMQPIFHLEDYFVCDGDVAWDADYIDFVHVDKTGNRVLDHSKLDLIRTTEDTKMGGNWKDKKEPPSGKEEEGSNDDKASVTGSNSNWTRTKARRYSDRFE
ncbi:unnamed protein product [Calypogeia fissa]